MDFKVIDINTRNWVDSAQDRDYWSALVNAAFNLRVHISPPNWLDDLSPLQTRESDPSNRLEGRGLQWVIAQRDCCI